VEFSSDGRQAERTAAALREVTEPDSRARLTESTGTFVAAKAHRMGLCEVPSIGQWVRTLAVRAAKRGVSAIANERHHRPRTPPQEFVGSDVEVLVGAVAALRMVEARHPDQKLAAFSEICGTTFKPNARCGQGGRESRPRPKTEELRAARKVIEVAEQWVSRHRGHSQDESSSGHSRHGICTAAPTTVRSRGPSR
jgi:hypothetical protein